MGVCVVEGTETEDEQVTSSLCLEGKMSNSNIFTKGMHPPLRGLCILAKITENCYLKLSCIQEKTEIECE